MKYINIMFVILSFMLTIIIVLFNKVQKLEKKSIENFNNNNVEHMTAVDEKRVRALINEEYNHDIEAIRNLGAISKSLLTGKNFHNTDGTATSGDLTIPANVRILGNLTVDGNAEIGPAFIGNSHNNTDDYATFCHKGRKNDPVGYSILQDAGGTTHLNTKHTFIIRKNNGDIANISENGAEFGNAYIGKWVDHNYAAFCNKTMNTAIGYGLIQHWNGTTLLNSKHNLHFRHNNDGSKEVKLTTTGLLDVKNGFSQSWNLQVTDQPRTTIGNLLVEIPRIEGGFLTTDNASTTTGSHWEWKLKPTTGQVPQLRSPWG